MKIQKYKGKTKIYKIKKNIKGDVKMGVSIARIPIIKGKAAEEILNQKPSFSKEFLKECEEVTKELFGKKKE